MKHTISLTEGQKLALSIDRADVADWLDNFVASSLNAALTKARAADWWGEAMVALVSDGGEPSDSYAVLLKARALGHVETATEREARLREEAETGAPMAGAPGPATILQALVSAHGVALKVAAVNAANQGRDDWPTTAAALIDIERFYQNRSSELALTAEADRTSEEVGEIARIKAGYAFWRAVDAAAAAIVAAGDPVDPIADDPRWPAAPVV